MKVVIDWIIKNYQLLILVGACVLDLVLFLISVFKKNKVSDPAISNVIRNLPAMVSFAEKKIGVGHGDEKLKLVLHSACALYRNLTGTYISIDSNIASCFKDAIEDILSTPQKKGKE